MDTIRTDMGVMTHHSKQLEVLREFIGKMDTGGVQGLAAFTKYAPPSEGNAIIRVFTLVTGQ